MKKYVLATSVLAALAGLTVLHHEQTAVHVEHQRDFADSPAPQGAPTAHANRRFMPQGFASYRVASGALSAKEIEVHPAVQRALSLLKAEKARLAAAAASHVNYDTERYSARDVIVDADGTEHVRFDRELDGLPLIGGDMVSHVRDGHIESLSHSLDLQWGGAAKASAALSPAQALARVRAQEGETLSDGGLSPRMVYFADAGQPKLAYEVAVQGTTDGDFPVHDLYYVDAQQGDVLGRDSLIQAAAQTSTRGTSVTRGNVQLITSQVTAAENEWGVAGFLLRHDGRGASAVRSVEGAPMTDYGVWGAWPMPRPMYSASNIWGQSFQQRVGVEVHDGITKSLDYFWYVHGRMGVHNNGAGIQSYVNMQGGNAFYDRGRNRMVFGNGYPGYTNPFTSIDIAAHELTHGVTAQTSRLMYSGDSGGLNESLSDVQGSIIEYYDNNPSDPPDFLLGENISLDRNTPTRYMFKPSLDGASYDCYPAGGFTSQIPHVTSGVGNHFTYLLSEGMVVPASHANRLQPQELVCNDAVALRGIGRPMVGYIWYRANALYLTSQSSYPVARAATQTAAMDLLAQGYPLPPDIVNVVACAWEAVKVPLPPGYNGPTCRR